MKNPVDIEKKYQDLLSSLSYPVSPREHIFNIKEFIDQLQRQPDFSESYLLEVMQYLPDIIHNLDITGIEPYLIRSLYENLLILCNYNPELSNIAGFDRSLDSLRFKTAMLYAYTGNPRMTAAFLKPAYAEFPPKWIADFKPGPQTTPYEIIRHIASLAIKNNDTIVYEIERIINEWEKEKAAGRNETIVPVVELSYGRITRKDIHGGALRKVHVKIFGETGGETDDVHPDIAVYGARSPIEFSMKVPVIAARNLIARTHPPLKTRYVAGQIKFDYRYAMHEGSSANAAIAAAIYCGILNKFGQRTTYRISPGVAITGDIDTNGKILPVDEDSLRRKIHAVIFSYVDYLVVPKEQLPIVNSVAEEMKEYYPGRHLTIIGIEHLREIFFDRRLTELNEISAAAYIKQKIRAQKYGILSVLTIFFLLLIIIRLLYGPLDQNPMTAHFLGKHLIVENKNNQEIHRINVGEHTIERINSLIGSREEHGMHFAIYDVTGDGYNEIIWFRAPESGKNATSVLYCKSIRRNEILWELPLTLPYIFPDKPYANGKFLNMNNLFVDDLNGDGRAHLIVTGQDIHYFPGFVMRIDARTGIREGYYLNTGMLRASFAADINGNGKKEIITGGTNNAFEEAVLIVLDADFKTGHSPLKRDYRLANLDRSHENAYVRIPRTIIGELLKHRMRYNWVYSMHHNTHQKLIHVYITDYRASTSIASIAEINAADYIITFNYDLEVQHVGTADNYDIMSRILYEHGHIDARPDIHYFREYANSLKYLNDNEWQHGPVRPKRISEFIVFE